MGRKSVAEFMEHQDRNSGFETGRLKLSVQQVMKVGGKYFLLGLVVES